MPDYYLSALHAGADALYDRKMSGGQEYPCTHRKGNVSVQDDGEHLFQREIQRRHLPAEMIRFHFNKQIIMCLVVFR